MRTTSAEALCIIGVLAAENLVDAVLFVDVVAWTIVPGIGPDGREDYCSRDRP